MILESCVASADFGHLCDNIGGVEQCLCLRPFESTCRFAEMDFAAREDADATPNVNPLCEFLFGGMKDVRHMALIIPRCDFHRGSCSLTAVNELDSGNYS